MSVGFVIRPERPDDHAAIAGVVAAAFGSRREAGLVEAIRASPEYVADLALVAEEDGQIVGHVMVSFTTLDDGATRRRILHLSPLAVEPARQRRGIGSALVEAVADRAAAQGAEFVVLEGDPQFYGRLGFEPATPYGISIDLPGWAPPEAAQIRWLTEERRSVTGRVVYPPAFDGLDER